MKKACVLFMALALAMAAPFAVASIQDLSKAFENGEIDKILKMLDDDPQLLKADMGAGMTPLHESFTGCPVACHGVECMPCRGGDKGDRKVPLIHKGPCSGVW